MCPRRRRRIFSREAADDAARESKARHGFSVYAGNGRRKTQGARSSAMAETGGRKPAENGAMYGKVQKRKDLPLKTEEKKAFGLRKFFSLLFESGWCIVVRHL